MKEKLLEDLVKEKFHLGRTISYSKSLYMEYHPHNKVFFDAHIVSFYNNNFEDIWNGDLDLNIDSKVLKEIAIKNDVVLYIIPSHHYHNIHAEIDFNNYTLAGINVWNTKQIIIKPLKKKEIKLTEKYNKLEIKKSNASQKLSVFKIKELNKNFEIDYEFVNKKFTKKIKLPFDLIEKEFEKIKLKVNKNTRYFTSLTEENIQEEIYHKNGYLSAWILEEYLKKELKLKKNESINPCGIWMSHKSNKKLRKIDLKTCKLFNNKFRKKDFGRFVTSNYCIDSIDHFNTEKISIKSYEDDTLYIRNDVIRKNEKKKK